MKNGWPIAAGRGVITGGGGFTPTLGTLTLSPTGAVIGTAYTGTVSGKTAGSVITLTGAGAAGLSVSGSTISGTPTTAGVVNLVETLSGATGSPRTTNGALTVSATVTLGTLTLSPSTATTGSSYFGTISGATSGSTISLSGTGAAGLSVSGTSVSGTPTTAGTADLVETLAGATGSPKTTSGALSVAAAVTLNALTLSPNTGTVGTAYTGTVSGKTSGSTLSLSGVGAPGLSVSGTSVTGTPTTAGTVDIVETLSGATNTPRTSSGVITVAAAGLRPQDVFATSLYTGTSANRSITTGFQPDLVWIKSRSSGTYDHALFSSGRGATKFLRSNTTGAEVTDSQGLVSFDASGFSLGPDQAYGYVNQPNTATFAAWCLKYAPKFCVEVNYTGDDTSNRQIAHSLGVAPGMIIIKQRSASGASWFVYHRSTGANKLLVLNGTGASSSATAAFPADPSTTNFTIGASGGVNEAPQTYVAYLFAHDASAGGIIQCGSFTLGGSAGSVNLGWKPQLGLLKRSDAVQDWYIVDATRGWTGTTSDKYLSPNLSAVEATGSIGFTPTSTGISYGTGSGTYVYAFIREPT